MSVRDASIPTIVIRQAVDDCPPVARVRCGRKGCQNLVESVRGHRARRYCSDVCRQKAFQMRQAEKEAQARRSQLCADYPDFSEQTIDLLDDLTALQSDELVQRVVAAIACEVEQRQQGLEQVQERFRVYVEATNARLEEQAGELAKLRQERERGPKGKMSKADMRELEQARADVLMLRQARAREQEEFHQLVELSRDLQMKLGAARHRIVELEQQAAHPVMLADVLFELGAQLNYPELWFRSPEWKEQAKILQGCEYWRRFCERAAAWEVKAAYEVAKQRVESNCQSAAN